MRHRNTIFVCICIFAKCTKKHDLKKSIFETMEFWEVFIPFLLNFIYTFVMIFL